MQLRSALVQFQRAHPTFPGVALAVRTPTLSWTGAAGVSDRSSAKPLKPDAAFRIASVTKTFTAAAILRLVEDGKLRLDEPISKHLSKATLAVLRKDGYDVGAIHIRHLLKHSSGIYDFAEDPAYAPAVVSQPQHRWTRLEQIRFATQHGNPLFKPGKGFRYSDTGYVLLGEILERTTGLSEPRAYRALLPLDKLGLTQTYVETLEPAPAHATARSHQYLGTVDSTGFDPSFDLWGAGGYVSTTSDLVRFYRGLLGGRVFKHAGTLMTMLRVDPGSDGGMGIFAVPLNKETCWGHQGFWGTTVVTCPKSKVTIASNTGQAEGFDVAALRFAALVLRLAGPR